MRRKSAEQKIAEGNPGKRPIPEEVEVEIGSIKPPKEINKAAKEYWKKYSPEMRRIGKLTILNEQSFKKLCILWSKIDAINQILDTQFTSLLQETSKFGETELKENEYSKMLRMYVGISRQYEKDFGLTPDRMPGVYKSKKDDEFFGE